MPQSPRHSDESDAREAGPGGTFATTDWSLVLAAGADGARKHAALEKLCGSYWRPVYAFIRRSGHDPELAKDLAQSFFAHLLAGDFFATVDPERGRFRGYLCQSCRLFLGNEWQKRRAARRGGGLASIPWENLTVAEEHGLTAGGDPADEFDRQWALALLRSALHRLESEHVTADERRHFALLRPYLAARPEPGDYARLAPQLGVAPGTVPVLVHRLGKRYQALIRAEVAATLTSRSDIDAELRHCLQALG